jgi:hypothetical protein
MNIMYPINISIGPKPTSRYPANFASSKISKNKKNNPRINITNPPMIICILHFLATSGDILENAMIGTNIRLIYNFAAKTNIKKE